MRFDISSHHTPELCGIGNPGKFTPVPTWPERCKELGIEYVIEGGCQPEHFHFMVVDTDDMAKVTELMRPMLGRWTSKVTPIANINPDPSGITGWQAVMEQRCQKPSQTRGLSCFRDTPYRETTGGGVLKKSGACLVGIRNWDNARSGMS